MENADEVRDFYQEVIGWKHEALSMGEYSDYVMTDENANGVGGVCHARGANAHIPPQWIVYFIVASLDESVEAVRKLGGEVVTE